MSISLSLSIYLTDSTSACALSHLHLFRVHTRKSISFLNCGGGKKNSQVRSRPRPSFVRNLARSKPNERADEMGAMTEQQSTKKLGRLPPIIAPPFGDLIGRGIAKLKTDDCSQSLSQVVG